jgi:hypothetical protein
MSTLTRVPELTDPNQAIDVGFAEGKSLRDKGGRPELLDGMRDAYYETPHRQERRQNLHYDAWRSGFDAGYLDQPKPTLP